VSTDQFAWVVVNLDGLIKWAVLVGAFVPLLVASAVWSNRGAGRGLQPRSWVPFRGVPTGERKPKRFIKLKA